MNRTCSTSPTGTRARRRLHGSVAAGSAGSPHGRSSGVASRRYGSSANSLSPCRLCEDPARETAVGVEETPTIDVGVEGQGPSRARPERVVLREPAYSDGTGPSESAVEPDLPHAVPCVGDREREPHDIARGAV